MIWIMDENLVMALRHGATVHDLVEKQQNHTGQAETAVEPRDTK